MSKVAHAIDELFEDYGMSFVPHKIRYLSAIACVTSPFWIIGVMMLIEEYDKDDQDIAYRSSALFRQQKKQDRAQRNKLRKESRMNKFKEQCQLGEKYSKNITLDEVDLKED